MTPSDRDKLFRDALMSLMRRDPKQIADDLDLPMAKVCSRRREVLGAVATGRYSPIRGSEFSPGGVRTRWTHWPTPSPYNLAAMDITEDEWRAVQMLTYAGND